MTKIYNSNYTQKVFKMITIKNVYTQRNFLGIV